MSVKITPEEIKEQFSDCQKVVKEFNSIFSKKDNFQKLMDFAKVDSIEMQMAMSGYLLLRSLQVVQLQRCINKHLIQEGKPAKYPEAEEKLKTLSKKI